MDPRPTESVWGTWSASASVPEVRQVPSPQVKGEYDRRRDLGDRHTAADGVPAHVEHGGVCDTGRHVKPLGAWA